MDKEILKKLNAFGQSIWLDNISASLLKSGKLKELVDMGLMGLTSNPSIFEKSITSGADYDEDITRLYKKGKNAFEIYDELTVKDIQAAADLFLPVYEATKTVDGYVSLEVNPELADDADSTTKEAVRLWNKVDRPNLMLKIPATEAGFSAITEVLGEGMNVNATLIFSPAQYEKTAMAYIEGMKKLIASGKKEPACVSSVASVFVSRIDTVVDKLLDELSHKTEDTDIKNMIRSMKYKAAVANSGVIYKKYKEIFEGQLFADLKSKGAKPQRVLWASTSTKNPSLSDIKYVADLIARDTVNTLPDATLNAYLDHGAVKHSLEGINADNQKIIKDLKSFGVDVGKICDRLLEDGVSAFRKSFSSLLNSVNEKIKASAESSGSIK